MAEGGPWVTGEAVTCPVGTCVLETVRPGLGHSAVGCTFTVDEPTRSAEEGVFPQGQAA